VRNDTALTSSPASHCSQGGWWCFWPSTTTRRAQTRTGPSTSTRRRMTHHPPPASRATAHGVDHGWNDDADRQQRGAAGREYDDNDTPPAAQPHEQLLMGWMMGGVMLVKTGDAHPQHQDNKEHQGHPMTGTTTNDPSTNTTRWMTHHPPPALQATARGVGRGWNANDASNGEERRQQAEHTQTTGIDPVGPSTIPC
jgi:hypothetical protein